MTSRALGPKWKVCLAFVLVCQTAQRIGGHPRRPSMPDTVSPMVQDITYLIRAAYENGELLRSEQWSRWDDENDDGVIKPVLRDTSKQLETAVNDGTISLMPRDETQERQKGLWEAPSMETSVQSTVRSDDNIIFPTDNRLSIPVCENGTYCENVTNYPKQLVNTAIARNASLRFLANIDPLSDIEQRIDSADDAPLCQSREQVIFPQTAQNKENRWLFVVNQDNLKQGIRIEVCINDGQECNMIQDFAEGYKTTCKQKYIYRELMAVGSNGNVIKDSFRFPSSCCCHVKFIGDPQLRLRFGFRRNQTMATRSQSRM